ncbi:MAG: hypothetical protein ACP5N3_05350 [Candidatus Nanoarchaeia archaeon]
MDEKETKDKKNKRLLKEEYQKLKEKYSLPDYELLVKDFEIEDIDPEENIIREILEEAHDRIDFYSRLLEGLIQPDSKLCDMKEAETLTQEEQEKILELYRKCMLINRTLLLIDLDYDEKAAAESINHTFKEWQSIKKELKLILTKMRDTWKQETKKENHGGYYG